MPVTSPTKLQPPDIFAYYQYMKQCSWGRTQLGRKITSYKCMYSQFSTPKNLLAITQLQNYLPISSQQEIAVGMETLQYFRVLQLQGTEM